MIVHMNNEEIKIIKKMMKDFSLAPVDTYDIMVHGVPDNKQGFCSYLDSLCMSKTSDLIMNYLTDIAEDIEEKGLGNKFFLSPRNPKSEWMFQYSSISRSTMITSQYKAYYILNYTSMDDYDKIQLKRFIYARSEFLKYSLENYIQEIK
jgi:hypothetical protein